MRSKACGSGSRRRNARAEVQERRQGILAGIAVALPALTRALKLQEKAATVGFDWNDPGPCSPRMREEAEEIAADLERGDCGAAAAEVGDLLFAVVNLARHLGADPEAVLRATNWKFEQRFASIERALAERGGPLAGDARGNGRALERGKVGGAR